MLGHRIPLLSLLHMLNTFWRQPQRNCGANCHDPILKYTIRPEERPWDGAGIVVEIVRSAKLAAPRIEDAEDMGPIHLIHSYADEVSMTPEARARGLTILEVSQC